MLTECIQVIRDIQWLFEYMVVHVLENICRNTRTVLHHVRGMDQSITKKHRIEFSRIHSKETDDLIWMHLHII